MKSTTVMAMVGSLLLAGVVSADEPAKKSDETKTPKVQTTCPVMGGAIDKALYIDHDGKRIYVCCGGCIGAVKKDPAKYIKKLEAEGVTIEVVPADTNAVKAATAPAKTQ